MTPVSRDQFEIKSDVEVLHKPTGARFSTYRYDDPDLVGSDIKVNWGHAGEVLETGEDFDRQAVVRWLLNCSANKLERPTGKCWARAAAP
jgi:hypothetical protein